MSKNQVQKLEGENITSAASLDPATGRPLTPLDAVKSAITKQKSEFMKVLPAHISFEKFQRTVMTAVIQNPDLVTADRQSLLLSCIKSATDGLMPDGRDAALVIFNSKGKDASGREVWLKRVQYLPMYAGILKKVRQSGDLSSVVAHVVYQKDKFEYVLGDDEKIVHEPYMGIEPRGEIIAAYCIARLKDGSIVREVMTHADIEKVRKTSKSGNDDKGQPKGIWASWYEEMAKKTVFRRTAKWLPQQIELVEQAFKNDDSMEVLDQIAEKQGIEMTDENTDAEGRFIAKPDGQPDLKKEIEKKKNQSAPEKTEEKQTDKADVPRETKPEPEITGLEKIKARIAAADNGQDIYDIWSEECKDEIEAIKKADPQGYADLWKAYQDAQERVSGGN